MVEIAEEYAPDNYMAMRCVAEYPNNVKVLKMFAENNYVYFSITQEPDVEDIESPDDIETKHTYRVGKGQTGVDVEREAKEKAQSISQAQNAVQENGT